MSKPISTIKKIEIDEAAKRQRDVEEIEQAMVDNKEAVIETFELLGHLHDCGLLEFANGLFSQGDAVLRNVVQELNRPNHARMLQNLVGIASVLGKIDIDQVKALSEQANNGLKEAAATEAGDGPSNIFQLMKALKDPEISRSIGMMLNFLKGMGKA
ncbi:MAG TPA: DUF1641 domain-containing protein [Bacillales bacterium]|nr:DUF1641 domain-containing protein [Bacillales bacterium]